MTGTHDRVPDPAGLVDQTGRRAARPSLSVARLVGVSVHGRPDPWLAPLHGVDLRIDAGTLTVLTGDRDSGNATALLVLAGLVHADAGLVEVTGITLGGHSPDPITEPEVWRGRVGFVPDSPTALGYLTVTENLGLPVTLAGARAEHGRQDRLLRRVGLHSVRDRFPDELSPGQLRRLALGQALTYAPDLLVVPADPALPDPALPDPALPDPALPDPALPDPAPAGSAPAASAQGSSSGPSGTPRRSDLAASLIDLVALQGHTVVTALTDPVLQATAHHVVEFVDGRISRRRRR